MPAQAGICTRQSSGIRFPRLPCDSHFRRPQRTEISIAIDDVMGDLYEEVSAMNIAIGQIYYAPSQLNSLESAFAPFDNTLNPNREWAEYHVFEEQYTKGIPFRADLTGFVSWKFGRKTGITGERFLEFIEQNPDYDVYFIDPFPMERHLFANVWLQGEFYHPGILRFSVEILRRAGYQFDLQHWQQQPNSFAFCNYWAGSHKFWKGYMEFTSRIARILRSELTEKERDFLHSIASKTNNFSYIAFIMERMFSVHLALNPEIKFCAYEYSMHEIRRRFPGLRWMVFCILATRTVLLKPIRFMVSALVLLSRASKEQ
jgi:hypothetical protein